MLGLKPQFSILDSDDVTGDPEGCRRHHRRRHWRASWQWTISLWKNMGLNAAQALAAGRRTTTSASPPRVMARYEERLAAYQSVDFDDLIGLPLKLLRDMHAKCARSGRGAAATCWSTNTRTPTPRSTSCSSCWSGERGRFTAVGDDDQSIYGWRGATLDNLQASCRVDFPHAEGHQAGAELPLHQRHPARGQQRDRPQPEAVPEDAVLASWAKASRCASSTADNEEHEAERAVARIQSHPRRTASRKEWKDFAILYRANHQARVFEQALRKAQIPYKVSGGQSFFDRAEIKDLCAWLRLWVNNDDDPAFLRAVTTPKRGIGHQTLEAWARSPASTS